MYRKLFSWALIVAFILTPIIVMCCESKSAREIDEEAVMTEPVSGAYELNFAQLSYEEEPIAEVITPEPVAGTVTILEYPAVKAALPPAECVDDVCEEEAEVVPEEHAEPEWTAIDAIPLDPEYQHYVFEAAERYGVNAALILAIIEQESTFRPLIWDPSGRCYGLMQIHCVNYDDLQAEGIDALSYPGNIDAGALMISRLIDKYGDVHRALMAYNRGEHGAREDWSAGYYTSTYSRSVVRRSEQWQVILDANI